MKSTANDNIRLNRRFRRPPHRARVLKAKESGERREARQSGPWWAKSLMMTPAKERLQALQLEPCLVG